MKQSWNFWQNRDEKMKKMNIPFFLDLSEENRQKLLEYGTIETLKKNTVIFEERDEVEYVYIVLNGFVSIYRNSRYGEVKIMFILSDHELINDMVLERSKTSVMAKTMSDTKMLKIRIEDLEALINEDVEIAKALYRSLAYKTRRLYHQVGNANGSYPLPKHLAAKIWRLARDYGEDTPEGRKIVFGVTVTFLSNMLGVKRESTSRALSTMKKAGYIIQEGSTLIVPDMKKLREQI